MDLNINKKQHKQLGEIINFLANFDEDGASLGDLGKFLQKCHKQAEQLNDLHNALFTRDGEGED